MELEHSFTIPVPLEQAWETLLDVERVAPCMPGATVESVADDVITGRIKVKAGPVTLIYTGKARFTERDAATRSVTLEASGRETRGSGTATATVRSMLRGEGDQTEVIVHTTLAVTGRPAQFGRGMLTEVGGKIIDTFAAGLAAQLAGGQAGGGVPDRSVGELRLPARATASLRQAGLTTVADLAAAGDDQLLALAGIGPRTVSQIRSKLAALGVTSGGPGTAAGPAPAVSGATLAPGMPAGPAGQAAAPVPPAPAPAAAAAREAAAPPRQLRPPDEDALDLLNMAGLPVLKRIVPAVGGVLALVILVLAGLRRHRRRRA